MRTANSQGITVVELLVVMAVLGIILSLLTAFFASQARTTSITQANNEVQVKVRTAAEIMTQDLQMAGSRIVFNAGAATYVQELLTHCSPLKGTTTYCVKTTEAGSLLTIFYATSLRPGAPCRRIDYSISGDVLRRSEVSCAADPTVNNSNHQPFATRTSSLVLTFQCADEALPATSNPADCYTGDSFPQQATITLTALSDNPRENRQATVTLTTTMPNLRPVAVSAPPSGG